MITRASIFPWRSGSDPWVRAGHGIVYFYAVVMLWFCCQG